MQKYEQYEIENELKKLFKIAKLQEHYFAISFAILKTYKNVFENHPSDAFKMGKFTCRIIYNRKSNTINISFKCLNEEKKLTFYQMELAEFIYWNDNEQGIKRMEGIIYEII